MLSLSRTILGPPKKSKNSVPVCVVGRAWIWIWGLQFGSVV